MVWFQPSPAGWTPLRESHLQRWIMNDTEAKPGKASQRVLYNLLEGELLVDESLFWEAPKHVY